MKEWIWFLRKFSLNFLYMFLVKYFFVISAITAIIFTFPLQTSHVSPEIGVSQAGNRCSKVPVIPKYRNDVTAVASGSVPFSPEKLGIFYVWNCDYTEIVTAIFQLFTFHFHLNSTIIRHKKTQNLDLNKQVKIFLKTLFFTWLICTSHTMVVFEIPLSFSLFSFVLSRSQVISLYFFLWGLLEGENTAWQKW